tara:strand:- start:110 stop:457 length:348 start_codon:yes stop_codon:yes gene_type:complete
MLLCWNGQQKTPIHDHNGSDGWTWCLAGEIEEMRYTLEYGKPKFLSKTQVSSSIYTHINDDKALHCMQNSSEGQGVSLHLYAPPIRSCRSYCLETGEIKTRHMSDYSMEGKLVGS